MSKLGARSAHAADGDVRTRKRSINPNPVRRLAAAAAALALGAGLALVGVAAPAAAHHNTITADVLCEDGGTFSIDWSVENSEQRVETITASSNPSVVAVGTELGARETATFTQADVAPGTYELELSARWDNGNTNSSRGAVTVTAGQCDGQEPVKRITFCHATGSETNPYVRLTTSVSAFYKAGHIDHQDNRDIYPAFTYKKPGKNGELIQVAAQGDQRLLETEDCTLPDVPEPGTLSIPAKPALIDLCGLDRDGFTLPGDTDDLAWTKSELTEDGRQTVTVTIKTDKTFPDGTTSKSFEHVFTNEPCEEGPEPVTITDVPTAVDLCGTENDEFSQPDDTDAITWSHAGSVEAGQVVITATANEGYEFVEGTQTAWPFTFTDKPCGEEPEQPAEPTLEGSVATGVCLADAPWIFFDVTLTDADDQVTDRDVSLVLSDGEHTETLELGTLDEAGKLQGKTLWPGAAVDDEGNAIAWPGWKQLDNGTWVKTDGNYAWTHDLTSAKFVVNPELEVALAYPPATPDCIAAPPVTPAGPADGDGGEGDGDSPSTPAGEQASAPAGGSGLAETGFAGTSIAIVAGVIVLAGAAFVVVARVRRKKA